MIKELTTISFNVSRPCMPKFLIQHCVTYLVPDAEVPWSVKYQCIDLSQDMILIYRMLICNPPPHHLTTVQVITA